MAEEEGQRVDVGEGWSIELPRRFVIQTNPDGSWSGWDEARVIDIQLLSTSGRADGSALAAHHMLGGKDPTQARWHRDDAGLIALADLLEDSDAGGRIYRLTTESAVANSLMSCWIAFRDIAELDWALERWRSIRHD